ncbi:MAG TPA: alpha/beta hydrolase [Burkholderiales bacterium]|nr:alpha/beta hydrolase [Burkholderiales bacterium]
MDAAYYEGAYNPRLAVPEYADYFERWRSRSQRARSALSGYLDAPYGPHPMEKLDLFRAKGRSRALLVFIHGGYWRGLDKSDHTLVAPPFVERGVTVALVNYALAPSVHVQDIVLQVLQACAWLYRNGTNFAAPSGKLFVSGHSAGGHLTAMCLAALWPRFFPDLPEKVVQGGLSISGVYDLEPIVHTPSVNVDARLTPDEAKRVSPALMTPPTDAPLYTAVGGKEQEGFHAQNKLIREKWKSVAKDDLACPEDNHFTILERLATPGSALFQGAMKMMGL